MATIAFSSTEKAREAVSKFNGAPIDGGKTKLKLNLIVDPSKKPLAARITPLKNVPDKQLKVTPMSATRPVNKGPNRKAIAAKKAAKNPKREKKSLEQLDQEMADYFEESK